MRMTVSAAVAALVAAAFAGNVCTWTGAGGDGKFSNAANWSTPPVSGNQDLLYFPVGTPDAVSELAAENDIEGLSVAAIRTHGHNNSVFTLGGRTITLTGAATATCPEIPATTVISNYTALVLNAPLHVTRAGGNAYMRFYGQKLTVNGKISASDVGALYLYGRLVASYSDYIGPVERYPSASLGSHFNAPIEVPDTVLHENIGNNCGPQTVNFNEKVTAKELLVGSDTHDSYLHLKCAGNDVGRISFNAHELYLDVSEALDADTVICDRRGNYWMWNGNYHVKSGTHQTVDRIEGTGDYLSNASFVNSYNLCADVAKGAAEVEMRGTADASTWMCVRDGISLTWNPAGDFRQTFRDRESDTTGEITVKRGVFAVAGTAAFTGVPTVNVAPGATLEIASTNPSRPAFGALQSLLLGDGAICVAAAGTNPFAANKVMASLGTGAKFSVAAGVDVKLALLSVAGARIPDGVYAAGPDNPWIEGAGTVTVARGGAAGGATYWLPAGDGDWDEPGNWSDGVPTATSTAVVQGNGPSTIRLSAASVLPAKLSVRNVSGTSTVLLPQGELAWNPTELVLKAGGRIDVPAGARLVSDDAAGTVRIDGGDLRVSGGELVYANFHGSFKVQGSAASTGRVSVTAGTFQFSHKSQTDAYRLRINPYGELRATGGSVVTPMTYYPFFQAGGRIVVAGDAELRNEASATLEWRFGAGETVFEDDAVLRLMKSESRFHLTSYDATTPARMVFRGNACVCGQIMEDPSIGSPDGARSILEIDSAKPNTAQFGYRCNVGCDNQDGELVIKRGYVFTGYRGLNIGGSTGNRWNLLSTHQGAHGVLRMSGGALKLTDGGTIGEGAFAGFRLADGGPSHLARSVKGAFHGEAEVSGGVITNNASTVIGGGRGIGTYAQTGGAFLHRSAEAAFLVGCAGGTGAVTLGGGSIDVAGDVYVGGVLTNQLVNGFVLDQFYDGNYPVDQHDASGTLAVTGGTFRCAKNLRLGCDGTGTLSIAGAGHDFTVGGDLVLSNTTVAANGDLPGWTTASKLSFALDPVAGLAPLKVAGKVVNTAGTSVRVDLGHYAGAKKKIPLLTADAFEGAPFRDVEIVGDGASLAKLVQGAKSLDLVFSCGTVLVLR